MENDVIIVEILLNTNMNDLQSLCQTNDHTKKICHSQFFLHKKFDMLPFNIYRPILKTFNNLLYINYLHNVASKLINFMINYDNIVFYNNPNDTIEQLGIVSPVIVNRILNQVKQFTEVDKSNIFYGQFEGSIFLQYNKKLSKVTQY
jgi:hypothetical protein